MNEHDILYSVKFGSYLYGTNTPTSDLDLKYVYLPPLDHLLLGKEIKNKVKKTNSAQNTRNTVDDVDEEYIPLQVFARDFLKGQTYALEMAFSVDGTHADQKFYHLLDMSDDFIYRGYNQDSVWFVKFVKELRTKFLTSNINAMMGYAVNQASLYSFKGERLTVVQKFNDLILSLPINDNESRLSEVVGYYIISKFFKLAEEHPKYFEKSVYDVGGDNWQPCFKLLEKTIPFTNRISQVKKVVAALLNRYGARAKEASETNTDWKATMHALRIVDEGIELLESHKITLPLSVERACELLRIRRAEVPITDVIAELDNKLAYLKELEHTSKLPQLTPELTVEFEEWLAKWLHKFYRINQPVALFRNAK